MGIGLGLIAGGAAKGYQDYQDILAKRAQTEQTELQNKSARQKLDDEDLARQIGQATLPPGAVVPPGYDQQAAIQQATDKHNADIAARTAAENMSPMDRLSAIFHPSARNTTAAMADIGGPPTPPAQPQLAPATPVPTPGLGLSAPALAAGVDTAAPAVVGGPSSLSAPALAAGVAAAGGPPAPRGALGVAASAAAPGIADATATPPAAGASRLPDDMYASPNANGHPASTAPGGSNTRQARGKVQSDEDAYRAQAAILHAKGDYKGAMEAAQQASAAHVNGVVKDLELATPAEMSNVLSEATGTPREVKEINGQYGVFDENGKLVESFPSRLAMLAAVKTRMDANPMDGIQMSMSLQKEAREQLTASSNIQRAAAESSYLTTQAQTMANRDKREGIKSGHEDIDWQKARDTDKFLADPNNRLLDPTGWAAATAYQAQLHPHMLTSEQVMTPDGSVVRKPVNIAGQLGDQFAAAVASDPLVKGNKIAIAPKNGVNQFALQMHDGSVKSFPTYDKAAQAGRAEYPELYGRGGGGGQAAPPATTGRSVRGIGLGGGGARRPPAAAPAPAPAPAPTPAPAAPVKPLTPAETNVRIAQGYIAQPGRTSQHAQDLAMLQRFDSRPKGSSASGLDMVRVGAARSRVAEYTKQQAVIAAGGKPQAGR